MSSQVLYVLKSGNDSTGDGSFTNPFLTINGAINIGLTGASQTSQYEISIGPGNYNEGALYLPANAVLVGAHESLTSIQLSSLNLGSGFVQGNNDIVGLSNLYLGSSSGSFTGNLNFNGSTGPNTNGKLYITRCNIDQHLTLDIQGAQEYTQVYITSSTINGNLIASNLAQFEIDQTHIFGNISTSLNSGNSTFPMDINIKNSSIDGNFGAVGTTGYQINVNATNSTLSGSLNVSGSSVVLNASSDFLPVRGNTQIINGATLNLINDAAGLGYIPANSSNWSVVPTTVQGALDSLGSNIQNVLVSVVDQNPNIFITQPSANVFAIANTPHIYSIIGNVVQVAGQLLLGASGADIGPFTPYSVTVVPPPTQLPTGNWTPNISGQFTVNGVGLSFNYFNQVVTLPANGINLSFTAISDLFDGTQIVIYYNLSFTLS